MKKLMLAAAVVLVVGTVIALPVIQAVALPRRPVGPGRDVTRQPSGSDARRHHCDPGQL